MRVKLILLGSILALTSACGSSGGGKDATIVMKDPRNGATRTYKEVRDLVADGSLQVNDGECSAFAAYGAKMEGVEFPAGQAAFVKACEEGKKS